MERFGECMCNWDGSICSVCYWCVCVHIHRNHKNLTVITMITFYKLQLVCFILNPSYLALSLHHTLAKITSQKISLWVDFMAHTNKPSRRQEGFGHNSLQPWWTKMHLRLHNTVVSLRSARSRNLRQKMGTGHVFLIFISIFEERADLKAVADYIYIYIK